MPPGYPTIRNQSYRPTDRIYCTKGGHSNCAAGAPRVPATRRRHSEPAGPPSTPGTRRCAGRRCASCPGSWGADMSGPESGAKPFSLLDSTPSRAYPASLLGWKSCRSSQCCPLFTLARPPWLWWWLSQPTTMAGTAVQTSSRPPLHRSCHRVLATTQEPGDVSIRAVTKWCDSK